MLAGPYLLFLLVLAVLFIIYGTARMGGHPFLILLLTALGFGLLAGLPAAETVTAVTDGFGRTLGYIGIVIAAGTIIGVILEQSGAVLVMANKILSWLGKGRALLGMSFTGAVISIPVFADSGYVILAPLNKTLAARSGQSMSAFAVALGMGLMTTHVFVPPTPGPIAAAGELGANVGLVMIFGLLTSIPVLFATYLFARRAGRRVQIDAYGPDDEVPVPVADEGSGPSAGAAFAPLLVPVALIALRSVVQLPGFPYAEALAVQVIAFIGNPNVALILGIFLAFRTARGATRAEQQAWVGKGLSAAGAILLITGAGGAFGRVLQATPLGDYIGQGLSGLDLGVFSLLLPFLIAAALKTAQGSSTVAMITTASLMGPLLPGLGLTSSLAPVFVTLAIGAGSVTVSHANDSYFWVVSQFSNMDVQQAYRLHTVGSGIAGVTGVVTVFLLFLAFG